MTIIGLLGALAILAVSIEVPVTAAVAFYVIGHGG